MIKTKPTTFGTLKESYSLLDSEVDALSEGGLYISWQSIPGVFPRLVYFLDQTLADSVSHSLSYFS